MAVKISMSSHPADPGSSGGTDSRAVGDFTVDAFLTSQRNLCQRRVWMLGKQKARWALIHLRFNSTDPPPPPHRHTRTHTLWSCDKCFKLVLIMRVTEEEMEASADRQDEWSIYFGWFP